MFVLCIGVVRFLSQQHGIIETKERVTMDMDGVYMEVSCGLDEFLFGCGDGWVDDEGR